MELTNQECAQDEFLTIATCGRVDHINWDNLVRIEAFSNYSRIFMSNGKTLFVAKVLKKFEEKLSSQFFVRPHKTHIVNIAYVQSYQKGLHPALVLTNGDFIPVARNRNKKLKEMIVASQ